MNRSLTMEAADRRFGWFMSAPSLALLLAVILFPVFWALFTSVHEFTLIAPNFDTFTGADNYMAAIGDPAFRHSLWLTAFFVAAVVLIEFAARLRRGAHAQQRRALQADLLRHPALPAADEPGHRRPDLADVPPPCRSAS